MTFASWFRGLARATVRTQRTLVLVTLLWTAAAEQTLAITCTTLDYPGGNNTFANGIDGNNIVGAYRDSSAIFHGFLYNGTTYTALDHPLATNGTVARGISGGNIVGNYTGPSGGHGFLYNGTTYTTLDYPGSLSTFANGIDSNNIVGSYTDSSGFHGYLYNGTTYTTLDHPRATNGTRAQGIDGNNIVGQYNDSSGLHGFLYNGTTYTTLDYPGSLSTFAFGIDGNNIVGFSLGHGFLYDGTTYTTLDYPLVTGVTNAYGIDGNNIVGAYTTDSSGSSGGFHGFLATVPEPSTGVLGVIACGTRWCWRKRYRREKWTSWFSSKSRLSPSGQRRSRAFSKRTFVASLVLFCTIGLLEPRPAMAVITIDMVPVGNAGNSNDPADGDQFTDGIQNFGAVPYLYNIGKYEVTVGQYTAFLNAVGTTDTYGLYNAAMATDLNSAGIAQGGSSPNYSYSVIGSADHPVTYVSWGDAARFANWMHNNQPTGLQIASTTEDGAYPLNGATTDTALSAVSRKAGAQWFIPSENEWYKAAYHQPAAQGGDADNYWAYPTRTNSRPYSVQPPGSGAPTQSNTANYYNYDRVANGYNDGLAVTGSNSYSESQNYLTDAGAYTSATSPYGTFDQAGNVYEWNEALIGGSFRGLRGSSWYSFDSMNSSYRVYLIDPTSERDYFGFRVATVVPEPSTGVLGVIACGLMGCWRKRLAKVAMHRTFASLVLIP